MPEEAPVPADAPTEVEITEAPVEVETSEESAPAEGAEAEASSEEEELFISDPPKSEEADPESGSASDNPFEGFEDEQVEAWKFLMEAFKTDPAEAASLMRDLAESWSPSNQAPTAADIIDPSLKSEPLTKDDVFSMFEEYQQKAETERQQREFEAFQEKAVLDKAQKLGYTEDSPLFPALLTLAQNKFNGSLTKAHNEINGFVQSKIDDAVKNLRGQSESFPPVSDLGQAGALEQKDLSKLSESELRESIRDRLRNG